MIYCAREFSVQDIRTIKDLMEQNPGLERAALSRKLCELFAWAKPNGEIKEMTCRVALLRMQADGLIALPPSQLRKPRGKPHFPPTPLTDPQAYVQQPVHELGPLTLRPVSGTAPSRLWNEYIAPMGQSKSAPWVNLASARTGRTFETKTSAQSQFWAISPSKITQKPPFAKIFVLQNEPASIGERGFSVKHYLGR